MTAAPTRTQRMALARFSSVTMALDDGLAETVDEAMVWVLVVVPWALAGGVVVVLIVEVEAMGVI
jgi:hypothetical protein